MGGWLLTSGFCLRHWKAMVRSSVSRAVKACFAVAIFLFVLFCLIDVGFLLLEYVWVLGGFGMREGWQGGGGGV